MATTVERLTCAETAALVRKVLKAGYPEIRFSVRSDVYSGGASVRVRWQDGPAPEAVRQLVWPFEGAEFDGMQDLKTYRDTLLAGPNGPRLVHFGADFIFCDRGITGEAELRAEAERIVRARCAVEGDRFAGNWVSNLAAAMVSSLDFTKGESLEGAFRSVVLRQKP